MTGEDWSFSEGSLMSEKGRIHRPLGQLGFGGSDHRSGFDGDHAHSVRFGFGFGRLQLRFVPSERKTGRRQKEGGQSHSATAGPGAS